MGQVLLCNFGSLSFTNNHISFVLVLGRLTLGTNARENDALGSLDSINSGSSSHLDRRRIDPYSADLHQRQASLSSDSNISTLWRELAELETLIYGLHLSVELAQSSLAAV